MEVDRDPQHARFLRDSAGESLPDPPGGVGGEFEALAPVELLDGADEAEVALLDEIAHLEPRGARILAGIGHDEPQVGGDEPLTRPVSGDDVAAGQGGIGRGQLFFESGACCLPGLHGLGQLDFLFCGEQLVLTHRFEIERHRVRKGICASPECGDHESSDLSLKDFHLVFGTEPATGWQNRRG